MEQPPPAYLPGQPAYGYPQPGAPVAVSNYPGPPPLPPQSVGYYGYPGQVTTTQQQPTSNVTVITQPAMHTVVKKRDQSHHLIHLIISIFFPPWIFVWIFFCIAEG